MVTIALPEPLACIKWLFHFTDTRNLPPIRELGGLWSTAKLREMGVENVHPGGNQISLDADQRFGMDQYVHLCMHSNHPMEYLARQDGRIQKTMWLIVDDAASVLQLPGVLYCPGVANTAGIATYTIQDAADHIDFEAHYKRLDWRIPEYQARRLAAEKCEILVPDHLPLQYFEKYLPNG